MTHLSAHLAIQIHLLIHTVVHDGPLYRNKSLHHTASPPFTKYNTTCIRHSLMVLKFHHCGGTCCLGHNSDRPPTGHITLNVDKQPNSKRSHPHSVNQFPFGSALVIFYPLGCMQTLTTLHTPSISPQGINLLSLARKDRYPGLYSFYNKPL